jgi:prepilin-type N-terminal cleavage/methylation domain-containing protein
MKMHGEEKLNNSISFRLSQCAFTLIELLVVVAIILILAGISLKVMSIVGRKTATARTLMVLEQVKGALGAYYATYGSYPATSNMNSIAPYKRPSTEIPEMDASTKRGLTSFIMSGNKLSDFKNYPETLSFFNSEARRWEYYFDKLGDRIVISSPTNRASSSGSWYIWTNASVTIKDGWEREIKYSPMATNNQEGYRLWSVGADGVNNNGGGDDVEVTFQ